MEDIARLAGVSKSAVSLALSGKTGISPETRDRVLQIAKEHGYSVKPRTPSEENQTKALTFLVMSNSGIVLDQYYQQPFFRELIHFIEERCRSKGYSLLFSAIGKESFDRELRSVVEDKQSSGVILLGTNLDRAQIADIATIQPNLVVLDTCCETLPVHFVEINNFMGAYQAGIHMCGLGHRDIGYIASDVRIHNFEERKRGFEAALAEHHLAVAEEHHFSVAPTILSSQESLKKQLVHYLEPGRRLPTALFCECDYIAISAMKTLAELGYRIPEDISIVGFDNITESLVVTPELTTIHVEKERMAQLAVDLLTSPTESGASPNIKIKVDTRLITRQSSGTRVEAVRQHT